MTAKSLAEEDARVMDYIFRDIVSRWPLSKEEIPELVDDMINTPKPYYINLKDEHKTPGCYTDGRWRKEIC